MAALRGAAGAIAQHRPALVLQNSRTVAAAAYGYTAADFFGFFAGLGYRLLDLFGRPFGPAGLGAAPDLPWYTIATHPGSDAEAMVEAALGPILRDALHRATDSGIGDLDPWLALQPSSEYLTTHSAPATGRPGSGRRAGADAGGDEVIELGGISTIGSFLEQRRGVELRLIVSDLRHPYASARQESADADILALEVLQSTSTTRTPRPPPWRSC